MKAFRRLCRFFLAALFLFAAGAKIATRNDLVESYFTNVPRLLDEVFLLPESWGILVAWGVIALEIAAALMLLSPRYCKPGAALTGAMLVGFALFALYYRFGLGHEQGLECGCFGGLIKSQLGVSTAIRNLSLLVPVVVVLWDLPEKRSKGNQPLSRDVDARLFTST